MGGSITAATHAATRYAPCVSAPVSQAGAPSAESPCASGASSPSNAPDSHWEGTLAPASVI